MYEIRGGKLIEVRILPNLDEIENVQGNVLRKRALAKQKAKRYDIKAIEQEIAELKAKYKN